MKFAFIGCSLTLGVGLDDQTDNYVTLVSNHFNASMKNLSKGGNSNYNIFMSSLDELLNGDSDTIFVQWSSLYRYWAHPGPNIELFLNPNIDSDFNYRDMHITKTELQKFILTYFILNHDFKLLTELIDYCNILTKIASNETKQLVFINGLLPWTSDLADITTLNNFSLNTTDYTKELLNFNSRDDEEIALLFTQLHDHLKTLEKSLWVNQFESLGVSAIDVGNDNGHPGVNSHRKFADMIINYLKNNK